MVEERVSAMMREGPDQARLQFGAIVRSGKRVARSIEVFRHRVVKLRSAGRAMSGKQHVIIERPSALQRGRPAVKGAFADEDVNAVVEQILGDQYAMIGKPDHQRVLRFGMFEMEEFKSYAADGLDSRLYDPAWTFGAKRNDVAVLRVLFRRDAVADGVDSWRRRRPTHGPRTRKPGRRAGDPDDNA